MKYDIDAIRDLWDAQPANGGSSRSSFDVVFSSHSHYVKRNTIKKFLVSAGIMDYKCAICELTKWNNTSITLQLDHIDGDRHNNQLHNLRLLCPNCHSQTETFSKRGIPQSHITVKDIDIINAIKSSLNTRQALLKLGLQAFGGNYDRVRKLKEVHKIEFKSQKQEKPSKSELLDRLCVHSLKELSEFYGVSDNAIRKWMKGYGIPSGRNELRVYINDMGLQYNVKWRISSLNINRGEDVSSSKLTKNDIRDIRKYYTEGNGVRSIARQYNVSHGTISAILNGRSWVHVK